MWIRESNYIHHALFSFDGNQGWGGEIPTNNLRTSFTRSKKNTRFPEAKPTPLPASASSGFLGGAPPEDRLRRGAASSVSAVHLEEGSLSTQPARTAQASPLRPGLARCTAPLHATRSPARSPLQPPLIVVGPVSRLWSFQALAELQDVPTHRPPRPGNCPCSSTLSPPAG